MAKSTQIVSIFMIVLAFVGCRNNGGSNNSCNNLPTTAEQIYHKFDSLGLHQVLLRSDYYICQFKDSSTFIITTDCMLVREASHDMRILSTRAKFDKELPANIRSLISLIDYIRERKVYDISADSVSISFCCREGYYHDTLSNFTTNRHNP